MSKQAALVRGINVGGHNMVAMSDLRRLLEELGLTEAKSLLQSGNLVFESKRLSGEGLERLLEKETAKHLGLSVDYMVRNATEWRKVIARNPFPKEAAKDPSHLLVMFLKSVPSSKSVDTLRTSIKGPEVLRCDGKHLYVAYPAGIGRSKLTGTMIEKQLGARGTARNWNTILKVAALLE